MRGENGWKESPVVWQCELLVNEGLGMQELVGKLTARQLWALIVLIEGGSVFRHGFQNNQGSGAALRVDGADRG